MRRTIKTLRSQYPSVVAGCMWLIFAAITTLGINIGADDCGRLLGMATVSVTFWAILRHQERRRGGGTGLREKVDDLEQRADAQDEAWTAWRETSEAIDQGRRHLRGIAGGKG